MTAISYQLNQLYDLKAQLDNMNLHYTNLRRSIIPPEIQAALDEIDAEQKTAQEA